MPVKTDGIQRRLELELLVPGTPEQVWQAMATGPGIGAWFTRTEVDERAGGAIRFDLGGGNVAPGTITAWQPPFRLAYEERDWSPGAPPLATEIVITSRSGDRCLVRMVHSLFTDRDTWDDEMEGFERGWAGFFPVLRLYLGKYAGQPTAIVGASATHDAETLQTWLHLTRALNLSGANVGEHRQSPQDAPRLAGTIERVHQDGKSRELMIQLVQPGPGVALIAAFTSAGKTQAAVTLFLYGAAASDTAAAVEPEWTRWLQRLTEAAIRL